MTDSPGSAPIPVVLAMLTLQRTGVLGNIVASAVDKFAFGDPMPTRYDIYLRMVEKVKEADPDFIGGMNERGNWTVLFFSAEPLEFDLPEEPEPDVNH